MLCNVVLLAFPLILSNLTQASVLLVCSRTTGVNGILSGNLSKSKSTTLWIRSWVRQFLMECMT